MKFRFSGGSDDIVTVATETPDTHTVEEYYTYEKGPVMWRARLFAPDQVDRLRVTALLIDGCWQFAVGQDDEDWPIPGWPITTRQDEETRYSALLEIDAPDGSELTDIWPMPEQDDES